MEDLNGMIKKTMRRKFIFLFISLFIIGFFIGYDYSILTSRDLKRTSVEGSTNNKIEKFDSENGRNAEEENIKDEKAN